MDIKSTFLLSLKLGFTFNHKVGKIVHNFSFVDRFQLMNKPHIFINKQFVYLHKFVCLNNPIAYQLGIFRINILSFV